MTGHAEVRTGGINRCVALQSRAVCDQFLFLSVYNYRKRPSMLPHRNILCQKFMKIKI